MSCLPQKPPAGYRRPPPTRSSLYAVSHVLANCCTLRHVWLLCGVLVSIGGLKCKACRASAPDESAIREADPQLGGCQYMQEAVHERLGMWDAT